MYNSIINPNTNKEIRLNTTHGIQILTNYITSLQLITTKRSQLGGGRRNMVLPDDDDFSVPLNMYREPARDQYEKDLSEIFEHIKC